MVMTLSRRADAIRVSLWEEPAHQAIEPVAYQGPEDRRGDRDEAMFRALVRLFGLPADTRAAWLGGLMFEAGDDGRVDGAIHDGRGYRREALAVGPQGFAGRIGTVVVEEQ